MSEHFKKSLELRQYKGIDVRRRSHEMEMRRAAEWQKNALPKEIFEIGDFQITGRTVAADVLTGDFFNYFPIQSRGKIGIVVGDINGHGVEPAMYFLLMQQLFKDRAKLASSHQETMFLVEEAMKEETKENKRMGLTAMWMELNMSGEVNMVRNGHTKPLIIDTKGNSRNITSGTGTVLNTGFFDEMYLETNPNPDWLKIDVNTVQLPSGYTLLCYTDGLTDMLDVNGNRLGRRKVRKAIKNFVLNNGVKYSAVEMCGMLMKLAEDHRGRAKQFDDCTVVAVRNVGNQN
jgi:phosphoserine phosphatase RsbU/P